MAQGGESNNRATVSCERPRANPVKCFPRQFPRATHAAIQPSARFAYLTSASATATGSGSDGQDGGPAEAAARSLALRLLFRARAVRVRGRRPRVARACLVRAQ